MEVKGHLGNLPKKVENCAAGFSKLVFPLSSHVYLKFGLDMVIAAECFVLIRLIGNCETTFPTLYSAYSNVKMMVGSATRNPMDP